MAKPGFILFCLMIAGSAYGGDRSDYELIGFSQNGRFVAFERFGITDGGGFPYSEIFIVDAPANDYVLAPIRIVDQGDEDGDNIGDLETVRTRVAKRAASSLSSYGIVRGNRGTDVFDRNLVPAVNVPFRYENTNYTLELSQIETDRECLPAGSARLFELSLNGVSKSVMLQKDTVIPESRGCPFFYAVVGVWCNKNTIAVIIEYQTPGFEGPDTRQIIVTGNLP